MLVCNGLQGRDGCLKAINNNEGHKGHRLTKTNVALFTKEIFLKSSLIVPLHFQFHKSPQTISPMAEPNLTPELKTYKGNCHCSAFKFSIKIPELTSVTECNCSICFKKGYKWVFPGAECFTIEKGDGSLKNYEFGKCSMYHKVRSIS
jgi:hypothetical protein